MAGRPGFKKDGEVFLGDVRCIFRKMTSATEALVQMVETRKRCTVKIAELSLTPRREGKTDPRPLESLSEKDIKEARRRFAAIEPLLSVSSGLTEAKKARAAEVGVSFNTIDRWFAVYRKRNLLSDLAPKRRGKTMPKRVDPKVEGIIATVLDEFYLSDQKPSQKKVADEVERRCRKRRLPVPHVNTVRKRIERIDPEVALRRREGPKAADDRYGPIKGKFPDGKFPLDVVEIDHTELDIFVVDDQDRMPLGTPKLTLAVDIYSRMVVGLYLSLDPVSALSVGMCMVNAISTKETYLEKLGIKGEWPVWGIPGSIHTDNGRDFRSESIALACEEYGIRINWRPAKNPKFGGHIERLLGTVAKEMHSLPGTKFANVRQKGTYNPEKKAVLTLRELERLLVDFFVNTYHGRIHRSLGITPLQKWEEGIVGGKGMPGTGIPVRVEDEERLGISFLPSTTRTVKRDGIVWDGVNYFCEYLGPWIDAKKGRQAVKFLVRRDPRNISRIFLLDPEEKKYVEARYSHLTNPPATVWELREARKRLKEKGMKGVNEAALFAAIERRHQLVETAVKETKKVRRERQRKADALRRSNDKLLTLAVDNDNNTSSAPDNAPNTQTWKRFGDDEMFDISEEDMKPRFKEWD